MGQVKFFKGCLPQILLGPFLNTLTHIMIQIIFNIHALNSLNYARNFNITPTIFTLASRTSRKIFMIFKKTFLNNFLVSYNEHSNSHKNMFVVYIPLSPRIYTSRSHYSNISNNNTQKSVSSQLLAEGI